MHGILQSQIFFTFHVLHVNIENNIIAQKTSIRGTHLCNCSLTNCINNLVGTNQQNNVYFLKFECFNQVDKHFSTSFLVDLGTVVVTAVVMHFKISVPNKHSYQI